MTASGSGLRVLMVVDNTISGGHTIQATNTAAALRELGLDVTVSSAARGPVGSYDVVHSFGDVPRQLLREARVAGAAVVVTPIWWEYNPAGTLIANISARSVRAARLAFSVARRGLAETANRHRLRHREAALRFELADLLLPNSRGEAERLRTEFRLTVPARVIPNGFDSDLFTPGPRKRTRRIGVLCVGRLEPHKNQLGLIKQFRHSKVPLTIVGDEHPHHRGYAAKCRAAAGGNVNFVSAMPQVELVEFYRRAAVHVLPSWFETTGLVSLEAAATGCAVVTTERGYAREYFGALVSYCDPQQRGSIRSAVAEALSRQPSPELRAHVLSHYTWRHTAIETAAAYSSICGSTDA
jgi:glycosyltransferase involved in cell wall biosynthesis